MGHQLLFWQQEPDGRADAHAVYQSLMNDGTADGLRPLPLTPILASLANEFPEVTPAPTIGGPCPVYWEDHQTSVEFWWSDVHVGAELRPAGSWSGEVANRVIDVFAEFQVPLYDPQTGERFDSWLAT